jgi:hypothetical protein
MTTETHHPGKSPVTAPRMLCETKTSGSARDSQRPDGLVASLNVLARLGIDSILFLG